MANAITNLRIAALDYFSTFTSQVFLLENMSTNLGGTFQVAKV
jgi:hypothetical protein